MIVRSGPFRSGFEFVWNTNRNGRAFCHGCNCVQLTFMVTGRSLHSVAHKSNGPTRCLNTGPGLTTAKGVTPWQRLNANLPQDFPPTTRSR